MVICRGEEVRIVVVLDACSDGSESIARRHPVSVLPIQARKVGVARALGADQLLAQEHAGWPLPMPTRKLPRTGWWRSWGYRPMPSAAP
jgi:hypothetical protein